MLDSQRQVEGYREGVGATMTGYLVLWLSVLVFIGVGIVANVVFFKSRSKKTGRHDSLDSVLFKPDHNQ